LAKFLTKGTTIFVEGGLRTSSYDDKEGNKRYKTEIHATNIILAGRGRGGGGEMSEGPGGGGGGGGSPGRRSGGGGGSAPPPAGGDDIPPDDFGGNDDIPF
jgi:single-strand DNA-binding protein